MTCRGCVANVQGACKRHGESGWPRKGLAGLSEWDGVKCKGLANAPKEADGFAKGLHSSLSASADLQRACKGHDTIWYTRKRLARNPTKVLSLARGLREPLNVNGTQIYEQLKYWEL